MSFKSFADYDTDAFMKKNKQLEFLFKPRSVAVVGASKDETKAGGRFVKSFIRDGFKGPIYPVNPNEIEVLGLKAYPSVLQIPGEVDLVVITIPARAMPGVIAECAEKGVKFAIIFSAGFREIGDYGKDLEKKVTEAAKSGDLHIIGPNCMGIFNPEAGLNTIAAHIEESFETGAVAFIGQSGWASENIIVAGYDRGLSLSKVISCGNQADLTVTDYLAYYGDDPRTKLIGAYIEGLPDGRTFLNQARSISLRKPIIIWKAGITDAGARAVESHTASMAGAAAVWNVAFKQAGILQADHFDELVDFAVAFGSPELPAGNRIGILSEAGGGGAWASDAFEGNGLHVSVFPDMLQQQIADCLKGGAAPFSSIKNPVDLVSPRRSEYPRMIPRCIELMAADVDVILFFTYYPLDEPTFLSLIGQVREKIQKPIVMVPGYPSRQEKGMVLYNQKGIPALPTPERAAKAIAALRRYAVYRESHGRPLHEYAATSSCKLMHKDQ